VVGLLPTTPTFVLPYKRFAAPCLLERAGQYLHEDRATYRSTLRHNRCLIGYPIQRRDAQNGQAEPRDEQPAAPLQPGGHQAVVPPSLVWRMATWLGGLSLVLEKARRMILQHDPQSLCHRIDGSVAPGKARTPERLEVLQTARQLLLVLSEWEECFGRKFFPQFATRSGFD
jgi:hypothetical protein